MDEAYIWSLIAYNVSVQACCRSLIVDTLPIPSQQAGSAWGMVLPQMSQSKTHPN